MTILAQSAEIADAAKAWGDQSPALALGLLGMATLVYFFLRHLSAKDTAAEAARVARDIGPAADTARRGLSTGATRA